MAYTLGSKCAKNLCKRTVLLQLIIENVVTCFFWNTVYISLSCCSDMYRMAQKKRSLCLITHVFNRLECKGNYSATSNDMKLVHWPSMGGLLHLVQRGGDWVGPQPAQVPHRCTKCNSPPINGQCTNHRIAACIMVCCCALLMCPEGLKHLCTVACTVAFVPDASVNFILTNYAKQSSATWRISNEVNENHSTRH